MNINLSLSDAKVLLNLYNDAFLRRYEFVKNGQNCKGFIELMINANKDAHYTISLIANEAKKHPYADKEVIDSFVDMHGRYEKMIIEMQDIAATASY